MQISIQSRLDLHRDAVDRPVQAKDGRSDRQQFYYYSYNVSCGRRARRPSMPIASLIYDVCSAYSSGRGWRLSNCVQAIAAQSCMSQFWRRPCRQSLLFRQR